MRKKFRFSKNSITWKIVMLLILFIAPFNLAALYTASTSIGNACRQTEMTMESLVRLTAQQLDNRIEAANNFLSSLLKERDDFKIFSEREIRDGTYYRAETTSVEVYEETTKKVLERTKGRYSRVFISHHDMETGAEIMENMIELCEEIKAGTTDDVPFSFMGMEAFIAKKATPQMKRLDGKCGNLIYRKDHIYE